MPGTQRWSIPSPGVMKSIPPCGPHLDGDDDGGRFRGRAGVEHLVPGGDEVAAGPHDNAGLVAGGARGVRSRPVAGADVLDVVAGSLRA